MSQHFMGIKSWWLYAQNWENSPIYHVTVPIIICAPKALPFHPLLQMFLCLNVIVNSYLWTWHGSLEHLPIKLNIFSVLVVKSSFWEEKATNHPHYNKEIPSYPLCSLSEISKQERKMKNTRVLIGLLYRKHDAICLSGMPHSPSALVISITSDKQLERDWDVWHGWGGLPASALPPPKIGCSAIRSLFLTA